MSLIFGLLFVVGFGFVIWSQIAVTSKISKNLNVETPLTGLEIAKKMKNDYNLHYIQFKIIDGNIGSEYYNPETKEICLSQECAYSRSVSAVSIAAHEMGHAIQENKNEHFSVLRSKLVKPLSFISSLSSVFMVVILILTWQFHLNPLWLLVAFSGTIATFIFQIVNLPVEFDASKRALTYLKNSGEFTQNQLILSAQVLKAAALTYIAAAALTLIQLLRLLYYIFASRD